MHYVGSLSIHLAVPLGLCMCKGERVKQLRGLSAEQGCSDGESGRASQQLDTMLSCQMQKKFYNYNRGECSSMCGWAWACVCTWVLGWFARLARRAWIYCVSLESGENYGLADFASVCAAQTRRDPPLLRPAVRRARSSKFCQPLTRLFIRLFVFY